ncbi:G5 domain-containing protein [Micromonospora sp. ZYX-F-536]|uniref:G5 domain-containing protein n=1 Tax=Micromonospora sp. ZYX-F-536 TaxID=3457629 RepID=UPI0040406FC2
MALSFLLLCCAGSAIVGAMVGEPEPTRTGTAAEQAQQPILAAPAEPTEEAASPVAAPSVASTTSAAASPTPSSAAPSPVVRVTTVTERAVVRHGVRTVKDSSLAEGKRVVRTSGVDGVKTLTYQVTTTNGVPTSKTLVKSVVTKQPVTEVVAVGTKKPQAKCDPNYSPCVPVASDVDCAGGSGNGPAYVSGVVKVTGNDIYDLDRDNDGYGCD